MKLKSLPNFPRIKEILEDNFIEDKYNELHDKWVETKESRAGVEDALSEVGELDIPVPSVEDIKKTYCVFCSRECSIVLRGSDICEGGRKHCKAIQNLILSKLSNRKEML